MKLTQQVIKSWSEVKLLQHLSSYVLRSRMRPVSEVKLQVELNKINEMYQQQQQYPKTLYIQIGVVLKDRLQTVKIEEWCFSITAPNMIVFCESDTEDDCLVDLKQFISTVNNIDPVPLYQSHCISKTDISLTFDHNYLTTLVGENTFETNVDDYQMDTYNCTVSLIYNYEIEQEEEQFQILVPDTKTTLLINKELCWDMPEKNYRKYSEGLEMHAPLSFTSKINIPEENKLDELRQLFNQIDFKSINSATIKQSVQSLN